MVMSISRRHDSTGEMGTPKTPVHSHPAGSGGTDPDLTAAIRVWADSAPTPGKPLKFKTNTADKKKKSKETTRKTGVDLPASGSLQLSSPL